MHKMYLLLSRKSESNSVKTRSAAIAFFFSYFLSPSLFLLSLSSFFSRKIFGLILHSAFGHFNSVRLHIINFR